MDRGSIYTMGSIGIKKNPPLSNLRFLNNSLLHGSIKNSGIIPGFNLDCIVYTRYAHKMDGYSIF